MERIGYVGPLAEHAGISDQAVLEELRRHVENKAQRFELPVTEAPAVKLAERELIRWILSSPGDSGILDEIEDEDLEGLATAPILRMMREEKASGTLSTERLLDRLAPADASAPAGPSGPSGPSRPSENDALRKQLTRIMTEPSPQGPRQSARDCFNKLREERLERRLSHLRAELARGADDDNLTAEINRLARRIETLRIETRA